MKFQYDLITGTFTQCGTCEVREEEAERSEEHGEGARSAEAEAGEGQKRVFVRRKVEGSKHAIYDLTGARFGRLIAIHYSPERAKKNVPLWKCRCDCGKELLVRGEYLRYGHTQSCGCYLVDWCKENKKIHSLSKSREHSIWRKMISRCNKENDPCYQHYGARGIKLSDEWLHGDDGLIGFQCFYRDMGPSPSRKHSIDRINNELGYFNGNCRWATQTQQARNTRKTLRYEWSGQVMALSDLCEMENMPRDAVYARVQTLGWDIERAIKTPVGNNNKKRKP